MACTRRGKCDCSNDITTSYVLHGPEFETRQRHKFCLLQNSARTVLESIHLRIKWIMLFFRGGEVDGTRN